MRKALMALGLCLLVAPGAALAQKPAAKEPQVGVVEWQKLLDDFTAYQDAAKVYQQYVQDREDRLRREVALRMLTADEKKEYDDLRAVPAPTDQQKQRMAALEKLADDREAEFQKLQSTATLTDEQKTRLDELRTISGARSKELQDLQTSLRNEVSKKDDELMKPLEEKIKAALGEIAKERNFVVVLRKENVLYGGVDITSALLAKLNKK
jgi:Skp family chaperone for outer membrane proteins